MNRTRLIVGLIVAVALAEHGPCRVWAQQFLPLTPSSGAAPAIPAQDPIGIPDVPSGNAPGLVPISAGPAAVEKEPISMPSPAAPVITPGPVTAFKPAPATFTADPLPAAPVGRQDSAVSVEWVGPPNARLGQPGTYQIVVRNSSPTPVHQVVVRHRPPDGVTVTASEPRSHLQADGSLSWDLGTLAASQEARIDLRLLPSTRAELLLSAAVSFTGCSGLRVKVHEPKLAVKLTAPDKVVLGDAATVTITVSNPGDGPAERVRVKTTLPPGLEHARGRVLEVDVGHLDAREQRTIQLVCTTRVAGVQKCEAAATAEAGLTAQDAAALEVVLPRLDLTMSGPRLRYLDRHAVYVLKVANPGGAPATNVTVTDVLPSGFKFHAASGGGRYDFSTRTAAWFVGDLPPGQSREVTLEAVAAEVGQQRHVAAANAARGLKAEAEAVTQVEGLSSLGVEVTDADDPVEVGADTYYEVRLVNHGSKMETNVELTCTLPERMEFRGARCAGGCRFRVEGRDVIFEPVPKLAPRADVIFRIEVRGTASGDVRFLTRVKADGAAQPILHEETTKVYGDDALPH